MKKDQNINPEQLKKVLDDLSGATGGKLERRLDWIGGFFKMVLILILIGGVGYAVFLGKFDLKPLTPLGKPVQYNRGVFNITVQSNGDFEKGKTFLKDINATILNRKTTPERIFKSMPSIYEGRSGDDTFYTLSPEITGQNLQQQPLYILKHPKDQTAYRRDRIFLPPLAEGYSGTVVLEHILNNSVIDLVNLVAGYMVSKPLYRFKYSQSITAMIDLAMKQPRGGLISSYSNQDHSTHGDQLNAYLIHYPKKYGKNIWDALKMGDYFLVNGMVAPGEYFRYQLSGDQLSGEILFQETIFEIVIYKDGVQLKSIREKNRFHEQLKPGYYRVAIYKREPYFLGETPLFWVYFNFEVK